MDDLSPPRSCVLVSRPRNSSLRQKLATKARKHENEIFSLLRVSVSSWLHLVAADGRDSSIYTDRTATSSWGKPSASSFSSHVHPHTSGARYLPGGRRRLALCARVD